MVQNYMEDLVDEYLKELLMTDKRFEGVCACETCMDDMRAYALNQIKPFYITGARGKVFGQYQTMATQNKADIMKEIVTAVVLVSQHKHIG